MGAPANFSTNFNCNVATTPGVAGATLVSVDPVFGIGHLLVANGFMAIGDIIFEVRFTPFATNIDPPFFVPLSNASFLPALAGFTLFDSVGGILELEIFVISFGLVLTISKRIFFDFTLPVLIGAHNPTGAPGQWVITHI